MEWREFWDLIKLRKAALTTLVAVFVLVGLALTVLQSFKYSSTLRLLVTQNATATQNDPYAMARSNEYLGDVLSKVAGSTSFYNRVLAAGFNIDSAYFGKTAKQVSRRWNKTIEVKKVGTSGIISITAYHSQRSQAEAIARAVGTVLLTQHTNYHGSGNQVVIKLLDEPITSTYPVRPNIIFNLFAALILGALFAVCYLYLVPRARWEDKLFGPAAQPEPLKLEPLAVDELQTIDHNFLKSDWQEWRPDF